jgi:transposase-like protein
LWVGGKEQAVTDTTEPATRAPEDRQLAEELVERAQRDGVELVGPDGLLAGLTKNVLEASLEAEMTEHLGYDKHDPAGREKDSNSRNGTRSKTVLTDVGPVDINVPRDRDGSFEPKIVKKRQRRLSGVDEMVISLVAKGLTTGEVSAHMAEVYSAEVSRDTISRITDRVISEMSEWQNRPLDRGRFLPVVANYDVLSIAAKSARTRSGVRSPSTRRGRWLSSRATRSRSLRV